MDTRINQLNEVEFEFEVTATAADLEPQITKALREQRARTTLRGFRPGRVPLTLVKKLYGKTIGEAVAADAVQKAYEADVIEPGTHEVLGQPTMTAFSFDAEDGLHAVVRFGVRPEIELKDLGGETVSKLVRPVTDADVDAEIETLREKEADLVPVDEPAQETDYVVVDRQALDAASGTPIVGGREEDLGFLLDDTDQPEALRQALVGKQAGDVVRVTLEHGDHAHHYEVTLKEVKRPELPDLDADFIKSVTKDRLDNEEALRAEIRAHLEEAWERRSREMLENEIVERMVTLHPVPVPESVVEMYLDSFVEDLKKYVGGELPAGLDLERYRADRRPDAVRQARWMFLRDHLIEAEGLAVTEDDRKAFFEKTAGDGELTPEVLMQYYSAMPNMMEQLDQRLLSEKVFATLADRFTVVEKDLETMQAEAEAEAEARKAEAEARKAEAEAEEAPAGEAAGEG